MCPTSALGSTGLEQTPGESLLRELVPRLLNACPTEHPPTETDCIDSPTEVIPPVSTLDPNLTSAPMLRGGGGMMNLGD